MSIKKDHRLILPNLRADMQVRMGQYMYAEVPEVGKSAASQLYHFSVQWLPQLLAHPEMEVSARMEFRHWRLSYEYDILPLKY